MRLEIINGVTRVFLSKRNLQTLLNKVDDTESLKTLYKRESQGVLVVTAEPDETHYMDRPEGRPGPVHPKHDPDRICYGDCVLQHSNCTPDCTSRLVGWNKNETVHHTKLDH